MGTKDVRLETVPDPAILDPDDCIVRSNAHGDLRIGSPSVRRSDADDGKGRRVGT
ncbi:MAG: hypothetical protein QM775_10225 [Pirellulales bacterium]